MDSGQNRRTGPPPTRRGYDAREAVSALQKAVRRSDPDAALYWAMELAESGFAAWAWKRVRVIASEDVGPAAPGVAADVRALYENAKEDQPLAGGMWLAHAVIALASAPKSRVACWATTHHGSDHVERREVPDESLDQHTRRGKMMGRGRKHFLEEASRLEPWIGSLDVLEAEYREQARRRMEKDPSLPENPWCPTGGTSEPAHFSHMTSGQDSGQLALDQDEDR